MIPFYLEARPMMEGRIIELTVYHGTHEGKKVALGSLSFDQLEWESFRPIIIGGMRAASLVRIQVTFMDGTREEATPIRH